MQQRQPRFLLTHTIPVTLKRRGSGSYVNGVWTPGVSTDTQIQVNIQPLRGHELFVMPEADRSKEWVKLYTTADIRGISEGTLSNASTPANPDLILWDGRVFEVSKVSTYKMGVLNHTKAIAARIPESAGE